MRAITKKRMSCQSTQDTRDQVRPDGSGIAVALQGQAVIERDGRGDDLFRREVRARIGHGERGKLRSILTVQCCNAVADGWIPQRVQPELELQQAPDLIGVVEARQESCEVLAWLCLRLLGQSPKELDLR